MVFGLILLNVIVITFAVTGLFYFLKVSKMSQGELRIGMVFLTIGYFLIMFEHFVLAYLRRTNTPLESMGWFMLFPVYIAAIIFFLAGIYKLRITFLDVTSKKKVKK